MTTEQKRKILQNIVNLEDEIKQLKEARLKLATSEFTSASISTGSGSKSYTRANIERITETISQLTIELRGQRDLLKEPMGIGIQRIVTFC